MQSPPSLLAEPEILLIEENGKKAELWSPNHPAFPNDWVAFLEQDANCIRGIFRFTGSSGAPEVTCGIRWVIEDWSTDNYIFFPAGVYNGNRFQAVRVPYSPRYPEEFVLGTSSPALITDIPRLGTGSPRIQLKSGDLSFPAFGWFSPEKNAAWIAWPANPSAAADWLWEVEELDNHVTFRVQSPGVRQSPVYRLPMMQRPTPDRGWRPSGGDGQEIAVITKFWTCKSISEFFDVFYTLRENFRPQNPVYPQLPFSAAFTLIEEHYNRDNWRPNLGLYATECNPQAYFPFATGWCGGMIATYPLLALGSPETRQRSLQSIETFLQNAPAPNGLFFGKCTSEGKWTSDFSNDKSPHSRNWTLIRRQGDALYYLLKTASLLERIQPHSPLPHKLFPILRRTADTFVRIWRANGQFGQFIDQTTGKITIGGSTSGAIVPAALVHAYRRFREPAYLNVAEEACSLFARDFLQRGFTTGGPGDALQNPDSESIASLLISYVNLHRATNNATWLDLASQAAALLASWVMPYNFPFPTNSEFGRLNIQTLGSVFANTQNKHSAPGVCTHSVAELLYLWLHTRDRRHLHLALDIARFLPQCVSRPDRPIHAQDGRALPSGWINERVNTSDWDENIGGVFYGSCWCEVSQLLTTLEFPSILILPDSRKLLTFDHIEARWHNNSDLFLHNPTAYPAKVKILSDPHLLKDEFWFLSATTLEVPAGESIIVAALI